LTALIHVIGGVDAPYAGLAYLSLVTTAAVFSSRVMALVLAGASTLSLGILILLEAYGVIPRATDVWGHHYTPGVPLLCFVALAIFLFWIAWIFGSLADQLKAANQSLREFSQRIEEQNRTLELRVSERTAELARATQEIEDLVRIISHDLKNVAVAATET